MLQKIKGIGYTRVIDDNTGEYILTFHVKTEKGHVKTEETISLENLTIGKVESAFINLLNASLDGREMLIGDYEEDFEPFTGEE